MHTELFQLAVKISKQHQIPFDVAMELITSSLAIANKYHQRDIYESSTHG